MYTTYHLSSAQDITPEILDAIKLLFKSKPITIIVKDAEDGYNLTAETMTAIDNRLMEDETTYISGSDSIAKLKKRYDL